MAVFDRGAIGVACIGECTSTGGQRRPVVNVWCYAVGDGPFPAGWPGLLADAWHQAVWQPVAARLGADYRGQDVRLYDDPTLEGAPLWNGYKPADGQQPGARLPLNLCVAVTLRSWERGHQFVGRKRLGPVAAADVLGDELTDAAWNAWGDIAQRFTQQLVLPNGQTWQPIILSRTYSDRGPPPTYVGGSLDWAYVAQRIGLCRHRRERTER